MGGGGGGSSSSSGATGGGPGGSSDDTLTVGGGAVRLVGLVVEAPPPPLAEDATKSSLVQMGFPQKKHVAKDALIVGTGGEYVCPRCSGRIDELPSQCPVCRLTLVSSPHLARSYHHLFPVPAFAEYEREEKTDVALECKACLAPITGTDLASKCEQCSNVFCFACDCYIHEKLHNCPFCACVRE